MAEITKTILLKAPLERVWAAISDSRRFGAWFGVALDEPFAAGQAATGHIVPTQADPEVARLQEPHRGKPFTFLVDRIEPPHLFAFRWHPFALDPAIDYSAEPMTLVMFRLAEEAGGTRLMITEEGFEHVFAHRRAAALEANDGGWAHQARLLEKYLLANP